MDKQELKYQDQDYFNDTYLFDGANRPFQSKAHFEKGYWWTNKSMQYKCTSVKCVKMTP